MKKICIFGPESTGKTTLAKNLASRFDTSYVPEYAEEYIKEHGKDLNLEDMLKIAEGQIRNERKLLDSEKPKTVIFCDTDPLTTTIWSKWFFNEAETDLQELAQNNNYDLYLLLDTDVPWVDDHHRYFSEERNKFFQDCITALDKHGRNYVKIDGDWDNRFSQAVEHVEQLIKAA